MTRILVIGSGGREHALIWKLAQSAAVGQIYVAPGNAGMAAYAESVAIGAEDTAGLLSFAQDKGIDLTVVGPEAPLANGIVDAFQAYGLRIFGPTRAAAELEASKAFAKEFMREHNIPTGGFAIFNRYKTAQAYLSAQNGPVVIKASGLAAGKGVIVCDNQAEAQEALRQVMLDRAFGAAGAQVLIEERLRGAEVSVLAFCDGRTVAPMVPSRDHKRIYDGDEGPNTGGMGAYAPAPDVDEAIMEEVKRTVLQPVVDGMAGQGTPYVGVLYAGLMLTERGPRVLEFNCRFGDPETQVVLPALDGDLLAIMQACVDGRLETEMVRQHGGACAAVVMAAPGYPGSYARGLPIEGLDDLPDDVFVFHAGTARQNGQVVTSGGRVLAVAACDIDLESAVDAAYEGVEMIEFEGAQYRTDIGR